MLKKLFSPFGRLSRGGMWLWGVLVLGLLGAAAFAADYLVLDVNIFEVGADEDYNNFANLTYFSNVYFWLTLWPLTALSIKRFHDVGLSGWWYVSLYLVWLIFDEVIFVRSMGELSPTFSVIIEKLNIDISYLESLVQQLPDAIAIAYFIFSFLFGLGLIVITLIMPGNVGDNRYGSDPLDRLDRTNPEKRLAPPPWS